MKGEHKVAARALVYIVRLYKTLVSPLLGDRCRYYPSCSSYAMGALRRYGTIRGLILAIWRVLRCNPFSDGGVDHVEDQRVFKMRGRSKTKTEGAVI